MIARRWGRGRSKAARIRREMRSKLCSSVLWVDTRSGAYTTDPLRRDDYIAASPWFDLAEAVSTTWTHDPVIGYLEPTTTRFWFR